MKEEYADYLLKKNKKDYDLIADAFSKKREKIWPEMKFLFDDYLIPGEKVLDLGCGNGRFYELTKEKKVSYIGVDISEKLIKIAKERYPEVKFLTADALNLPFPNNYFDKVYAIALLHHIPSKEYRLKVLEELKRVLKEEGLLFLTVWNLLKNKKAKKLLLKYSFLKLTGFLKFDFKDILYPWKDLNGRVLAQRYFHIFNIKELGKILATAGFKVEKFFQNDNIIVIARKLPL